MIYDPVRDELFSASRGRGAVMNQRRIRVNVKDSLENTFLAVGHPYRANVMVKLFLMQTTF